MTACAPPDSAASPAPAPATSTTTRRDDGRAVGRAPLELDAEVYRSRGGEYVGEYIEGGWGVKLALPVSSHLT